MNLPYKHILFVFLQLIYHVLAFKTSVPISDVSIELPKPIPPLEFEELDTDYKQPRKLNSKTWTNDKSKKPSMVDLALEIAAREGINAMTDLYQNIEPQIVKNGQLLEENHPAALLSKFSAPVEGTERTAMAAYATLSATKAFRRNNKESTVLGRQAQSQKVSFRRTPLEGLCPARDSPTCMPASQRYRTHDGTCNNRRRLRWGSAQMPFNRFLPPEYGDGVDSIRGSVEGGSLSSARFVSLLVHGAREGEAPLTLMLVQWGQLLDHDLTSTAQPRSINGSVPSCCGSTDFHPSCFPIKVPLDDPWLAPLKVRCLEFLRSAPAQRRDCVLSWREQTNQVTSFIDASPIYSSNAKTSDNARIFRNGLLIYGRGDPADDVCMRGAIAHQCIRSGDGRSGEQPGLLALHHVWVGEHNRIAMELSILNPHWSDEKIYQETRRIIGAMFQHITYREFLPIVLGREVCKLFDLDLVKNGYYTGYDPKTNPSVSNAFAAAAFRFGHSLVQNSYMRCDRNHNFISNNVTLHEEFQQGDIGTDGSLHRLLRGLAAQKALKRDEFITPELTNHLFQTPGFPFGLDLAAINIQRGRDHGIASYTAWRQPCGLSPINSWDELSNIVGPESAKRISHAYRNVHDIDLFVGGIAERPVIGGLVGPTFACIIAQQFSNSRKGDRFWYENPGFESSFTPAQLNSLRHVSLSSVLCRALNGGTLQPHIFIPHDVKGNERVKCGKDIEPIDLRPWLEQDPFFMSIEKMDGSNGHNPSLPSPISTQMPKEEKGINNRVQNITIVANVDFIPNSSIGFHRVPNMTKIHDKLDLAQKQIIRTTLKPIKGINNKLDKNRFTVKTNHKPTSSPFSKKISTTRRTVVIHNVQIDLRSATSAQKEQKNKKKKTNLQQDSIATTAQKTIMKVAGVVTSQIGAAMGFLTDNDEDETNHTSRKMNDQPQFFNLTNNINKEHYDWSGKNDKRDNSTTGREGILAKLGDPSDKKMTQQTSMNAKDISVHFSSSKVVKQTEKTNGKINHDLNKHITLPPAFSINQTFDNSTTKTDNSKDHNNKTSNDIYHASSTTLTDYMKYTTKQIDTTDINNHTLTKSIHTQVTNTHGKIIQTKKCKTIDKDFETDNTDLTNTKNQTSTIQKHNQNTQTFYVDRTQLPLKENNHTDTIINDEMSNQISNTNLTTSYVTDFIPTILTTPNENNSTSNEYVTETNRHLKESHQAYKDFQAIIDSALQDSLDQHKRVHRKTDHTKVHVKKIEVHTNPDFSDKLRTIQTNEFAGRQFSDSIIGRTAEIELHPENIQTNLTDPNDGTLLITTEQPATLRNVELRQFHERPIYNRPQKVILDAPDSDQYEIEINIRQTNTKPTKYNTNYEDYNSPNKRYDTDRYNQHYDFMDGHHTPSNNFYTQTTRLPYGTRTKPPTIIYINEHDDHITTRNPGFFQNIISFATNGLNGIKQQTTSTSSPFNHNPNKIINSGHLSNTEHFLSSHTLRPHQHSKPSSSNYLNAPQTHPVTQGFPQHGFSQSPPNIHPGGGPPLAFPPPPNIFTPQALPGANSFSTASSIGGVSHASSSAVSTGHFGSIVGNAASTSGDSTFSFNIRPSPRPQPNLVSPNGIKPDYEFLPQRRPQYSSTPNYAVPPKPMSSVESYQYPPNKYDPFSSYTRRPPSYYDKIPNKNNIYDPSYDDIGRSDQKIDERFDIDRQLNATKNNEDFDSDEYDYTDDDDGTEETFGSIFNNDNVVEERESIKKEQMAFLKLAEQVLTNETKLNETHLDDNFVLPVLRQNDKFIQPIDRDHSLQNHTSFPTIEQKSLNHDILAEDYDEKTSFLDSQASSFTGHWNKLKRPTSNKPIAFAPIQILTKPERPDNWVIYDALDDKPLLPAQPEYNTETLIAAEVPMPFQKRLLSRISTTITTPQTTMNDKNYSTVSTTTFDTTTLTTEVSDGIRNVQTTLQDDLTRELDDTTTTKTESMKVES